MNFSLKKLEKDKRSLKNKTANSFLDSKLFEKKQEKTNRTVTLFSGQRLLTDEQYLRLIRLRAH